MELKEAVDILSLLLGAEDRDPRPEEIRKAGNMVLELGKRLVEGSETEVDLLMDGKAELCRALGYLEESLNRLQGETLDAALELKVGLQNEIEKKEGGIIDKNEDKLNLENKTASALMGADTADAYISKEVKKSPSSTSRDHSRSSAGFSELSKDIGKLLKQKRLTAGLRQKDVAEILGISAAYMSLLETGKLSRPSKRVMERIEAFMEGEVDGAIGKTLRKATLLRKNQAKDYINSPEDSLPYAKSPWEEEKWKEALRKLLEVALNLNAHELELLIRIAEKFSVTD